MDYLRENFADRYAVSLAVALTSVAFAVWIRRVRGVTYAIRVCAYGAAMVAAVATSLPFGFDSPDPFLWRLGEGGLSGWAEDLGDFPTTIQSVLLVGNVVLFVPLGLFVALGWRGSVRPLLAALAVPLSIEVLQAAVLRGVGSLDDLLLNALGILIGWTLGRTAVAVYRVWRKGCAPPPR